MVGLGWAGPDKIRYHFKVAIYKQKFSIHAQYYYIHINKRNFHVCTWISGGYNHNKIQKLFS